MKILNKSNGKIIEVSDKQKASRMLGYPDMFEAVAEKQKEETPKEFIPKKKNKK